MRRVMTGVVTCVVSASAAACQVAATPRDGRTQTASPVLAVGEPIPTDLASQICDGVAVSVQQFGGMPSEPSVELSAQPTTPASVECLLRPQAVGAATRMVIVTVMSVPDPGTMLSLIVRSDSSEVPASFHGHDAVLSPLSGLTVVIGSYVISVVAKQGSAPGASAADPQLQDAVAARVLATLDER